MIAGHACKSKKLRSLVSYRNRRPIEWRLEKRLALRSATLLLGERVDFHENC